MVVMNQNFFPRARTAVLTSLDRITQTTTDFIRGNPLVSTAAIGIGTTGLLTGIATTVRRTRKKKRKTVRRKAKRKTTRKRRTKRVKRVKRTRKKRRTHASPRHKGHKRVSFTTAGGKKVSFLVKKKMKRHSHR